MCYLLVVSSLLENNKKLFVEVTPAFGKSKRRESGGREREGGVLYGIRIDFFYFVHHKYIAAGKPSRWSIFFGVGQFYFYSYFRFFIFILYFFRSS